MCRASILCRVCRDSPAYADDGTVKDLKDAHVVGEGLREIADCIRGEIKVRRRSTSRVCGSGGGRKIGVESGFGEEEELPCCRRRHRRPASCVILLKYEAMRSQ